MAKKHESPSADDVAAAILVSLNSDAVVAVAGRLRLSVAQVHNVVSHYLAELPTALERAEAAKAAEAATAGGKDDADGEG